MFTQFQQIFCIKNQSNQQKTVSISSDYYRTPQTHIIKNRVIQEKKLLSEGAFGFIWRAEDINTKQQFAVKRVICMTKERVQSALIEKNILEQIPANPHLVGYEGGLVIKDGNKTAIIIIMELCPNGSLFDLLEKKEGVGFTENQLIIIALSILKGLAAIHGVGYYHRDIKIQNVLVGKDGKYKLCDFGSCTNQNIDFSQIPKQNYDQYIERIQNFTTPMYRSPQMADPYLKYTVSKKADIWMLGCLLYTLCYFTHPFLNANTVGISNAVYRFLKYPSQTEYKVSEKMKDFIRLLLTPDPSQRPDVYELINILAKWDSYISIPLNSSAKKIKNTQQQTEQKQVKNHSNKQIAYPHSEGQISMQQILALQQKLKNKKVATQTQNVSFINSKEIKKLSQKQNYVEQIKRQRKEKIHYATVQNKNASQNIQSNQMNKMQNVGFDEFWGAPKKIEQSKNYDFANDFFGNPSAPTNNMPLKSNSNSIDFFENATVSKPQPVNQSSNNGNDFFEFFNDESKKKNEKTTNKKKQEMNLLDL